MRKFTALFVFCLLLQNLFADVQDDFSWSENFNSVAANAIPAGWSQYSRNPTDVGWHRSSADDLIFLGESHFHGSSGYAMMQNYGANVDNWLVSPAITIPVDGRYALSFWSQIVYPEDYRSNSIWISTDNPDPTVGNYIKVWNPLSYPKNNYIIAWFEDLISLAAYQGQTIYIAFVYQGDSGHDWYIDDLSIVPFIPPVSDLSIESVSVGKYTQLPVNHVAAYQFSAKIKNSGASLSAPVDLHVIVDNPESYSGNASIGSLAFGNEIQVTATPAFSTAIAGTYTATYALDITDETPENNTATAEFIVTSHTFAMDNGHYGGFTSPIEPFIAGNCFELQTEEVISLLSICFATENDEPFRIKIYSVDENLTTSSLLYTSPEQYYSVANANRFSEYFIAPQTLPAGKYFFAVESLAGHNIGIAYDNAYGYSNSFYFNDNSFVAMPVSRGNLLIRVNTMPNTDVAVHEILTPESSENLADSEAVTITIANRGKQSVQNIELKLYLDNDLITTEYYTETLTAGQSADYTFNQKLNLSEDGKTFTLKVIVSVEGDEWASNNEIIKIVQHFRKSITLYGYRTFDDVVTQYGFVSFQSSNPSTVTTLNHYTDNENFVGAGEYINGKRYLFTTHMENNTPVPVHFIQLDDNGEEIAKSPIDLVPDDVTYDHSTKKLYAVSGGSALFASALSTVDLVTGQLTKVADINRFIYAIAADLQGRIYAVDVNGIIGTINKTTGEFTILRTTGITPQYVQSAAFDHASGRLFWAMMNEENEGKLIEIDPVMGFITDWGTLGDNTEITALHTPYIHSDNAIRLVNYSNADVYAEKGKIIVNNCSEVAYVQITDLVGYTIYTQHVRSKSISVPVQQGIYVVSIQSDNHQSVRKILVK